MKNIFLLVFFMFFLQTISFSQKNCVCAGCGRPCDDCRIYGHYANCEYGDDVVFKTENNNSQSASQKRRDRAEKYISKANHAYDQAIEKAIRLWRVALWLDPFNEVAAVELEKAKDLRRSRRKY